MATRSSRRIAYGQYCPISRALDVLGERWTLLIVRDLLTGSTRFNDLARGLPGLSRSLLSKRLRQLERDRIVEKLDGEYLLTEAGEELYDVVFGLGRWGARWAFGDPDPDELDPELLAWWMHDRFDTAELPDRRVVVELRFTDDAARFWFVTQSGETTVCLADPGFEVDVLITAGLSSLYRVWVGQLPLRDAVRDGHMRFDGPAALTRRMPAVLRLSPIAPVVADAVGVTATT